jgi:hypothetical protein
MTFFHAPLRRRNGRRTEMHAGVYPPSWAFNFSAAWRAGNAR